MTLVIVFAKRLKNLSSHSPFNDRVFLLHLKMPFMAPGAIPALSKYRWGHQRALTAPSKRYLVLFWSRRSLMELLQIWQ